jgi:uncharacterized protein YfkK (UPF0435 family)
MSKAAVVGGIEKSLEAEIGRNIHEVKRTAAVSHLTSAEHEMTADNLGTLFRRMAKLSMSEVDDLIDELQRLRKKLENDGDLIEQAIEQHSQFSQGTLQLTTMIADNVKKLRHPMS